MSVVVRARLLERIEALEPRVLVLEAPAGFGKTTLVRQATRGEPIALIDARGVREPADLARRIVEAAAPGLTPEHRARAGRDAAMAGASPDAWRTVACETWRANATLRWAVLENAERLADDDELTRMLDDVLDVTPGHVRLAVCTRTPLRLRLTAIAPPHEILVLSATDLRFDEAEIRDALVGVPADAAAAIVDLSRGWPMAVYLLRRLYREGLLGDSRLAHEPAALADYLSDQVLALLDPAAVRVLVAAAAIPSASHAELVAATGTDNAAVAIRRALDDAPFFSRTADTFEVHPLMRTTLCTRFADTARAALCAAAAANARTDEIRAAQLYLEAGDELAAAGAIRNVTGFLAEGTPSLGLSAIVARLPAHAIVSNPALWAASIYFRRYQIDPFQWLSEGLAIWQRRAELDADVRIGVAQAILNAYAIRGDVGAARRFLAALRRSVPAAERERTELVADFWSLAFDAYAGASDLTEREDRIRPMLASTAVHVVYLNDVVARTARVRGDVAEERAAVAKALDAADSAGLPLLRMLALIEAAITAWYLGDDAAYDDALQRLDALATPLLARGVRHFLDCAYGRPATPDSEKIHFRCWGWMIAAARASGAEQRAAFAALAREAADESSQPYTRAVARIASALCEPARRERWLDEAAQIAADVPMPAIAGEIAAIRERREARLFRSLVARYERPAGHRVDVALDRVQTSGTSVALADRPRQIVMYLAAARDAVHRDELLRALWPDDEPAKAVASLRTLMTRIREQTGDREFVKVGERGYALGPHVAVDLREIEDNWDAARRHDGADEGVLIRHLDHLAARDRGRADRWEWFGPVERRIDDLARAIARHVARHAHERADARTLLHLARALLRGDPVDDEARSYAVRAHLLAGDRDAARREIEDHERHVRAELAIDDPSSLRSMLAS